MKTKLLEPKYIVIGDYPSSLYAVGDFVEEHEPDKFHYQNCGEYQFASAQTLDKYPHLFQKIERKDFYCPKIQKCINQCGVCKEAEILWNTIQAKKLKNG